MPSHRSSLATLAHVPALLVLPASVHAQTIVGGSDIISTADVAKLGDWLGEGPLQFTKFYTTTSVDPAGFHAAADNKGRTFTVALVDATAARRTAILGGYLSESWTSRNAYILASDPADRDSFIFDLTADRKLSQIVSQSGFNNGVYTAYDDNRFMPTWGGGNDVTFGDVLGQGIFTSPYSYSDGVTGLGLLGSQANIRTNFTLSRLETFTIAAEPVPEPASLAILGLGLVAAIRCRGASDQ